MKKIRVGILFGGRSAEHDVSILSARNIVHALDRTKYEPVLIAIDRTGAWLRPDASERYLVHDGSPGLPRERHVETQRVHLSARQSGELVETDGKTVARIDVVFPVLHGPFGEDGTVQGLLKLANVPFVGADVLGSAVGMDKDVMKRLLRDAKIPVAPFLVHTEKHPVIYAAARRALGSTIFVKPANLGSSVGVSKTTNAAQFDHAIKMALQFDTKVILEKAIKGREIEVSVLGNERPEASVPGEIIPTHEFYSYEAKYLDENGARLEIPAKLSKTLEKKIRDMAVRAYTTLTCEGFGRVDMFLTRTGKVYVNEINTIPGFTNISMYPKLWEASGVTQKTLLDKLIRLAIERHERQSKLHISR